MNSERQKREREIERLMQGTGLNREAEVQFQEEIKKTASAIFEEETRKLQKSEKPKRRKWSMNIATVGLWLIALAVAGFPWEQRPWCAASWQSSGIRFSSHRKR
jgi:ferric-dicitrate binding protein FerR (iron transport regulator)